MVRLIVFMVNLKTALQIIAFDYEGPILSAYQWSSQVLLEVRD